jgi:hypothetical protein
LYVTGGLAVSEVKFNTQPTLTAQLFDGSAPIGAPITVVGSGAIGRPNAGPKRLWRPANTARQP